MTALIDNTTRAKNVIRNAQGLMPTYREILEMRLVERGFVSKNFSHKKEPANRQADSLLLEFDASTTTVKFYNIYGAGKNNGFGASRMSVQVDFYAEETVIFINHEARNGGCVSRETGKVKFTQPNLGLNPTVILNYVDAILHEENIYKF